LKQGLADVRKEGSKQGANQITDMFKKPEVMARLHSDPTTAPHMADPQFMASFNMALANPAMFTQLMQSDQRFMACLQVGLGLQMQDPSGAAPTPPPPQPKKPKKEPEKELTEEEKAAKAIKDQAAAEKVKGTEFYKKKDFEPAIAHYTKAFEIDSTDITFLNNRAACHFEKKVLPNPDKL